MAPIIKWEESRGWFVTEMCKEYEFIAPRDLPKKDVEAACMAQTGILGCCIDALEDRQ